jgi:hypothetical protein
VTTFDTAESYVSGTVADNVVHLLVDTRYVKVRENSRHATFSASFTSESILRVNKFL